MRHRDPGVIAIRSVLQSFNGLKAGQIMDRLYTKFELLERGRGSMFFMELHIDAIDWDRFPSTYPTTYYSTVLEWYHNLSRVRSCAQGISMWFGQGLATYMHGNLPVASWEAIYCIGAMRPDGSVVRFFPHLQYVKERPLEDVFGQLLNTMRLVDIEFDEPTVHAEEHL